MVDHCTKCKEDGHKTLNCDRKPWAFHDQQECDNCGKGSHGHDVSNCTIRKPEIYCDRCGHGWHHYSRNCKIKDFRIEANRNQYTKPKYEEAVSKINEETIKQKSKSSIGGSSTTSGPSNRTAPFTGGFPVRNKPRQLPTFSEKKEQRMVERKERNELLEAKRKERSEREERWRAKEIEMPGFLPGGRAQGELIISNFFRVRIPSRPIHKYRIELDKIDRAEPSNRKFRRKLIENLLGRNPPDAGIWASDYFSHVISVGKLYKQYGDTENTAFPVKHTRPNNRNNDQSEMHSQIIFEGIVRCDLLDKLVKQQDLGDSTYHPSQDLNALNILSWATINHPGWRGLRFGKKFYPENDVALRRDLNRSRFVQESKSMQVQHVYDARTGFFTSMRPGIQYLLLNVNVTTAAFFPAINLQRFIDMRWGRIPLPSNSTRPLCNPNPEEASELKDLKVFWPATKEKRTINAISSNNVWNTTFGDGNMKTRVFDHMERKYGPRTTFNLSFHREACCIDLGFNGSPEWFPADHLEIFPGQKLTGTVPEAFTASMLDAAKKTPQENRSLIENYARGPLRIVTQSTSPGNDNDKASLRETGLDIDPQLISIKSRFLSQPNLYFGGKYSMNLMQILAQNRRGNKASWDLASVSSNKQAKFYSCVKYPMLKIIQVHSGGQNALKGEREVAPFANKFVAALRSYGFTTADFKYERDFRGAQIPRFDNRIHISDRSKARRQMFGEELKKALDEVGRPDLVMIILLNQDATIFSDIKWWADCVQGIRSICVLPKVLTKGPTDASFLANLSLKLNFKLGGTNHRLGKDWYGAKENTMIVGADVSHVTKDSDSTTPSMAGLVATCDRESGQYLASARLQSNNTESIAGLEDMIIERLRVFFQRASPKKLLPEHILFYRDGVSESQYGMVIDEEIPRIRNGCKVVAEKSKQPDWAPKITLVVVGKRHHTRFFPENKMVVNNLHAGLIIDHDVIHPNQFSFYLQSHDSPLGTARSGHYVVLLNESKYTATELQETTHGICFTGSRSTTSLSVCTPARYADILCDRLRAYMRPVLNEKYQVKPTAPNKRPTLDDYRRDGLTWHNVQGNDSQPWHRNLDHSMFYL